jgi:hypothetical protein
MNKQEMAPTWPEIIVLDKDSQAMVGNYINLSEKTPGRQLTVLQSIYCVDRK